MNDWMQKCKPHKVLSLDMFVIYRHIIGPLMGICSLPLLVEDVVHVLRYFRCLCGGLVSLEIVVFVDGKEHMDFL